MPRTLLLFAHPALEKSRVNRRLIEAAQTLPDVTFHDLYEAYPDFHVDVQREQELLLQHELIIWQHPLYWYSIPPLLKQWMDLTLEHNWAYGSRGVYLRGKQVLSVVSVGGSRAAYADDGHNTYSVNDFLRPLEQTARLCGMDYLPPYVIHATHGFGPADLDRAREAYASFLSGISSGTLPLSELHGCTYANDLLTPNTANPTH